MQPDNTLVPIVVLLFRLAKNLFTKARYTSGTWCRPLTMAFSTSLTEQAPETTIPSQNNTTQVVITALISSESTFTTSPANNTLTSYYTIPPDSSPVYPSSAVLTSAISVSIPSTLTTSYASQTSLEATPTNQPTSTPSSTAPAKGFDTGG